MRWIHVLKRVLHRSGSIFLHCDTNASHIARLALDDTLGTENFRSEIIWYYKRWSNSKNGLLPQHQTIFYYTKSDNYKFHKQFSNYSATTNVDQILQKRARDMRGKSVYAKDDEGSVVHVDSKVGVPLGDVWEIPFLNPKAKERVGYPTQKPLLLLEKIIQIASDENDLILDPFCGSGTTCVAAKLLKRRAIGIDISKEAVSLAKTRLDAPVKTHSNLLKKGEESYLPVDTSIDHHLAGLDCNRVARNKGIDAILKKPVNGRLTLIRVQRDEESLEMTVAAIKKAARSKGDAKLVVVATRDDCSSIKFGAVTIIKSIACQLFGSQPKSQPSLFSAAA